MSSYFQRKICQTPRVGVIRPMSVSTVNTKADDRKEAIVIVGAGIAGLASAVSLQRFINFTNLICIQMIILFCFNVF